MPIGELKGLVRLFQQLQSGQPGVLAANPRHLCQRFQPEGVPDLLLAVVEHQLFAGNPVAEDPPAGDDAEETLG